jgi:tetratricopeptide (TPR) repeat protein/transcriptional regulator with XRE-family HTH domain
LAPLRGAPHGGEKAGTMSTDTPELTFAMLLRRYRLAAGVTQEELAERARLSVRGITDLERGARRAPRKDTVHLLAEAFALSAPERAAFEAAARRHLIQQPQPEPERSDGDQMPPSSSPDATTAPAPASAPVYGGFLGALPAGPLVGREPELRRLLATLEVVATGKGRLLLLAGEPGVGKTRLAQELMVRTQERGFRALTGRCDEQYASLPFFPFVEVLTGSWRLASPALCQIANTRFAELGRLLPLPLPVPPQSEMQEPRLRLLHTVAGFLQALAAEGPLALLLDDLHWADSASLDLLAHLARTLRGDRVLLLGTYRDVEVGRQHPLESTLTSLTRDRVVELITLRGLPPAGTGELIRARFGVDEVSTEMRDLVHERTEGNPFFTEEVLSALVEQGAIFRAGAGWDRKAVAEIAVPQSIRSVVGQRVGRLATEAQELLRLASVLGQEWELAVLLGATEQDEAQVLDHLDAALAVRLLEERRMGRDERYGFVHALIGQALYEEVPRHRLRRLHLRAGEALERARGERPETWAELARHFLAAGDEARASRYSLLAGDHAAGLYAHAEAVQHYEVALELLEQTSDEIGAVQVCGTLGPELRQLGRFEAALAVLERAAARWQATGDLEGLGRVTAEIGLAHTGKGTPQEGIRRLQEVLPLLEARGPSAALVALYDALAFQFISGRYTDYLMTGERLAELAGGLGDSRMVARAGFHRANALALLGQVGEALGVSEETISSTQDSGDPLVLAYAFSVKGYIQIFRGKFDSASRCIQQSIAIAERLGDPFLVALVTAVSQCMLFLFRGDWVQARKSIEQVVATSVQLGETLFSSYALLALGTLCMVEGQWEEADRHLEAAAGCAMRGSDMQGLRHTARALAELAVLEGQPDAAVARLVPLLDRPGLEEFDVTYFLPVLAWAYLELGDLAQAEQVIGQALRRARAEQLGLMLVDALRVQALVAARQGRPAEATQALDEGMALARAMPYPYAEARQLELSAGLRRDGGKTGAACEQLEAALCIFRRLGARKDVEHTEQQLAALS